MKFELYKDAVLTRDVPEHRLKRGDIVKLVDHHVARDGSEGYSIEVFNAVGETVAVITLRESQIEPLSAKEILHVRPLATAAA
jgi:hypothetical protein